MYLQEMNCMIFLAQEAKTENDNIREKKTKTKLERQ